MDAALAGIAADFPHPTNQLVYKVQPRTIGCELLFQTWLEAEAYKALLRHRATLGEEEYARLAAQWHRDCAAGAYEWGGETCWRKLQTAAGQERLAFLKVQEGAAEAGGPAISEEEVHALRTKHPEAWAALLRLIQRQDFPEAAEGGDPNAPPPAAAGG